ncbi:hexosaminidase D [Brevipalpus obovatus]|uniref:hexosaminidase D n=1 Tax=Brevipalpus obovatus TaxID=246614 RepID=UPI003D9F0D01
MVTRTGNRWLRPVGFYVFTSLWKRKPLLLAVIMVISFAVVALQYKSVGNAHKISTDINTNHETSVGRFYDKSGSRSKVVDTFSPQDFGNTDQGFESNIDHKISSNDGVGEKSLNIDSHVSETGGLNSAIFNYKNDVHGEKKAKYFIPELRYVHFDLKGAPPKISYLKTIIPLLKAAGANGIVIEYEDMFPYKDDLQPIAAKNAYTEEDILSLLEEIKKHGMEIMPLVPTFGHMEFVLKIEKFRNLREVDAYPMALCPSKNESLALVKQLIDQMLSLHQGVKWLNIGCDEVFQMGYCDRCRNKDHESLYLDYVSQVARYVREKHKIIPVIWDDMLRNFSPDKLKESGLGKLVEIMMWVYVKDVYRFIPYSTFAMFAENFDGAWAATAFKGAYGETLTVPNVKMHLENHEGWLETLSEQHNRFKSFRGVVVTGWQRYDHLGVLCELFPSGLPSLIVDLITLKDGHYQSSQVFKQFDEIMHCATFGDRSLNDDVNLDNDPYLYNHVTQCEFPGAPVYRMTQTVSEAIKKVDEYIYDVTIHKAWLTDYNIRHNISNPVRVDEGLAQHSSVRYILNSALKSSAKALSEVFDEYTVYEWIEQNIYPHLLKMDKLLKDAENLKLRKVWPIRPLNKLEALDEFGLKKILGNV